MKHGKTFVCRKLRMLTYLVNKGFLDYEVVPDPTSAAGHNWFLFKNSDELEDVITEYFAQFK